MAFLIPESIASRSDVSGVLQSIAKAFRDDVPDDVTVWLDREGDAGEQYLTVLDPTIGIALIYAPPITARDMTGGLFRRREVRAELPGEILERARSVRSNVSDTSSLPSDLPAVALVAVPAASERSLERLGLDRASTLIDADFRPGALRPALARALAGERPRSLTDSEERAARAVLKPEIVISGSLDDIAEGSEDQLVFRPPEGEEDVIRVLDRQQERLAHHLGEGYRVIRGVAGSGKTLILTFRAKWYAENFPNRKVLLTCFNVPLMKALEAQLNGSTSVTVKTIDSVAYETRGRSVQNGDWTAAREEATAKLRADGGKYDVVLVDEAQDLDVAGLDLAYAALKKGRDDFVVALDGAQNVYRKSARWNPPSQTARGRSTILRLNYRNTKEILEFAHRFIGGTSEMPTESLLEDPTVIVPPEATSRRGPKPAVILCRDATHEVEATLNAIEAAHDAGARWGDMAVLYGTQRPFQTKLYFEARDRGIPYFWVSMNHHTKKQVIEAGDVVRCATMQGLKGLEFSRVFMCGVNDIYDPGGTDDHTVRRIAYVAMTRAMDELTITVSGNGPIGTAIQAANR